MPANGNAILGDLNRTELDKIGSKIDSIIALCFSTQDGLRDYAFKFQYEQAAAKAAYESGSQNTDPSSHLRAVLQRMIDLALCILQEVAKQIQQQQCNGLGSSQSSESSHIKSPPSQTFKSPEMLRNSSVEDFSSGSFGWIERGAHVSQLALEVLSSSLLASAQLRSSLQDYIAEKGALDILGGALSIDRERELLYHAEGFKTEVACVMANLSFENVKVSNAMAERDDILFRLLAATKVDEENPGMVEWAEFAIRNICSSSASAREKLKKLKPQSLSTKDEQLLSGKCNYKFTESGKLELHRVDRQN